MLAWLTIKVVEEKFLIENNFTEMILVNRSIHFLEFII
jgi:hypothetical protein